MEMKRINQGVKPLSYGKVLISLFAGTIFGAAGFGLIWGAPILTRSEPEKIWMLHLFGLPFALLGLGLLGSGLKNLPGWLEYRSLSRSIFLEPWRRDFFRQERLLKQSRVSHIISSILLIVVGATFIGLFSHVGGLFNIGAILGALVLLSGILIFINQLIQLLKYKPLELHFERFPYILGEAIPIILKGLPDRAMIRELKLRITCRYEYTESRGSGKNRRTVTHTFEKWTSELAMQQHLVAWHEGTLRFDLSKLNLPIDDTFGTNLGNQPYIYWNLDIEAECKGVDFNAIFPLPIYARKSASDQRPETNRRIVGF